MPMSSAWILSRRRSVMYCCITQSVCVKYTIWLYSRSMYVAILGRLCHHVCLLFDAEGCWHRTCVCSNVCVCGEGVECGRIGLSR